jgi:hypothetical protein
VTILQRACKAALILPRRTQALCITLTVLLSILLSILSHTILYRNHHLFPSKNLFVDQFYAGKTPKKRNMASEYQEDNMPIEGDVELLSVRILYVS